jgi:hypothetical protein
MKFFTDHYFHIGSAHYTGGKPCQDYALSGANTSIACGIVSDGCSTGRHTDVGSRVLTLSTFQAIREHAEASGGFVNATNIIASKQERLIGTTRLMLGLEKVDMLATCLYSYFNQYGGLVHIQGDGVIAVKMRDGNLHMYRYDWVDNTPFYPSYRDGGIESFVEAHGGDMNIPRLFLQTAVRDPDGKYHDGEMKTFTLREGISGIILRFSPEELARIDCVAVFSDGVTQVDNVDWKDAVYEFLAFKQVMGDFATRRMRRGIKEMQTRGKGPIDDISYAVVRIEPDTETKEALDAS